MSKRTLQVVFILAVTLVANVFGQEPPVRSIASITVSGGPVVNSDTTGQANIVSNNSRSIVVNTSSPISWECVAPSFYVYNTYLSLGGCSLPGTGPEEGTFNFSVKLSAYGADGVGGGSASIYAQAGVWGEGTSVAVPYTFATYTLSFAQNAIYSDAQPRQAQGTVIRSLPTKQETSICLIAEPSLIFDNTVMNFCEPIAAGSSSRTFTVTAANVSAPTTVNVWGLTASATIRLEPVPTGQQSGSGPSGGKNGCLCAAGEPINIANGNTWVAHTDYSLPGLGGGMALTRTWNSLWQSNSPVEVSGIFGHSWRSNFEPRLQIFSDSVKFWHGDGNLWTFNYDTVSGFYFLADPVDERASLSFDATTSLFTVTLSDKNKIQFKANGYIDRFVDRNNNQTVAQYDETDRLITITDPAGRVLTFAYGNTNFPRQATSVSDVVGTIATYLYDSTGRLQQVTFADSTHIGFTYNSQNLLLSVLDNEGIVLEAHTYDSQRRGLTSERANGVDKVTVAYTQTGLTRVTDSKGNHTDYTYRLLGTRRFMDSINGPGCASCGGRGVNSYTYDYRGNRTSSTDALGRKTAFTYDANGNVSSVIPPN